MDVYSRSLGALALAASLLLAGCVPAGRDGPPPTDLYLVEIWAERGMVFIGDARNLTERSGWDNQPAFEADGDGILYSSMHGDRADVWRYRLSENAASRAHPPNSERVAPHGRLRRAA